MCWKQEGLAPPIRPLTQEANFGLCAITRATLVLSEPLHTFALQQTGHKLVRVDAARFHRHRASVPQSSLHWQQSSLVLELGTGGQSTRRAGEARALPPSPQLTLHVLHMQHQADRADEGHLEVRATVADELQLADVITERDSCTEQRFPPWVPETSYPAPLPPEAP